MQNKNTLMIVIAVVLLIAGGLFFFLQSKKTSTNSQQGSTEQQEEIFKLKPEDIGLDFHATPDKKYVEFVISKPEGIEHIDYDILYDAISNGETVSQGLTGEIPKDEFGSDEIRIKKRELGTCSTGGKCRFDEGVKKVTIVLKLQKNDGKTYQVEQSIDL